MNLDKMIETAPELVDVLRFLAKYDKSEYNEERVDVRMLQAADLIGALLVERDELLKLKCSICYHSGTPAYGWPCRSCEDCNKWEVKER